jgi:hypothetical protein
MLPPMGVVKAGVGVGAVFGAIFGLGDGEPFYLSFVGFAAALEVPFSRFARISLFTSFLALAISATEGR